MRKHKNSPRILNGRAPFTTKTVHQPHSPRIVGPTQKYNGQSPRHLKPMNNNLLSNSQSQKNVDMQANIQKDEMTTKVVNETNGQINFISLPIQITESKKTKTEKQKQFQKIENRNICLCELNGIINFALFISSLSQNSGNTKFDLNSANSTLKTKDIFSRLYKKHKKRFLNGEFTPNSVNEDKKPEKEEFSTELKVINTIEAQNYLHIQSDKSEMIFKDLSNVFGVQMTEARISDPNPLFDSFMKTLQSNSKLFSDKKYVPYDPIPFPFIVGVGGPRGSGKTTVCQFFQKAFQIHIIDVKYVFVGKAKKGDKSASSTSLSTTKSSATSASVNGDASAIENEEEMPPPEYPLKNSIPIRYSDDKVAVSLIVQTIKENFDGNGFIIDGFPNTKNQLTALEKALTSANLSLHDQQLQYSKNCPLSARAKASLPHLDGVIVTTFNNGDTNRLIDMETGNIYKSGFYMPGLADLIGEYPHNFLDAQKVIASRLGEYSVDNIPILVPKVLQKFTQFESSINKPMVSIVIGECPNALSLLEQLDGFIENLFKKIPEVLPVTSPLTSLIRPLSLIRPECCFNALSAWIKCIDMYGRPIAEQSNLVTTLSNKVGLLHRYATERYQLLISRQDDRSELCRAFMKEKSKLQTIGEDERKAIMSQHFRKIWDLSIDVRSRNLEKIDELVDKCGIIELLLELRKSPKIVFIALVHRLMYIKWFYEKFTSINTMEVTNKTNFPFFDDLKPRQVEVPSFCFRCAERPSTIKTFKSMHIIGMCHQETNQSSEQQQNPHHHQQQHSLISIQNHIPCPPPRPGLPKPPFMQTPKPSQNQTYKPPLLEPNQAQAHNQGPSQTQTQIQMQKQAKIQMQVQTPINDERQFHLRKKPSSDPRLNEGQQQQLMVSCSMLPPLDLKNARTNVHSNPRLNFGVLPGGAYKALAPETARRHPNSDNSPHLQQQQHQEKLPQENQKQFKDSFRRNDDKTKERKYLVGIHGFNYLRESLPSYSERPSDSIFFDSDGACKQLGILNLSLSDEDDISTFFENDPIFFAEAFFSHLEEQMDTQPLLAAEAKLGLKIFKKFTTICKKKEASMVNAVFDLRDSLIASAFTKCTNEMEMFAKNFRFVKHGGNLEEHGIDLFNYDYDGVNDDIKHLSDLSYSLKPPISTQSLISPALMMKVARNCSMRSLKFSSFHEFMLVLNETTDVSEYDTLKFELCLRITECIECFDVMKFLMLFTRNNEDVVRLTEIFKNPPIASIEFPKANRLIPVNETIKYNSNDDEYDNEEEEEEEEAAEHENGANNDDDDTGNELMTITASVAQPSIL